MKLFKDSNNTIYAYELDGSQDHLIGDKTSITQQEADAITQSIRQAQFDALSYSEKRATEYPPMTDYLDGIVKNDQAQINKYIADCQAVKAKYPK
jgi:hypothetical protein